MCEIIKISLFGATNYVVPGSIILVAEDGLVKEWQLLVSISACQDSFLRANQWSGSRNMKYVVMPMAGMMT